MTTADSNFEYPGDAFEHAPEGIDVDSLLSLRRSQDANRSRMNGVLSDYYDEEAKSRWAQGWEKYVEYCELLSREEKESLLKTYSDGSVGIPRSLQAVFLGELPCCLKNNIDPSALAELSMVGLEAEGDYVYNPASVRERMNWIEAHFPSAFDVFAQAPSTPRQLMKALTDGGLENNAGLRGIVFGFPNEAVVAFHNVPDSQKERYGSEDLIWVDSPNSLPSIKRQRRLQDAFGYVGETFAA